jgi:hypothetical protein
MEQQVDPNQYQTQQVPVSQDEMYANLMQEERVKNIISQVSPENQLYEIEMRIKGYRKNQYTNQWEKISADAPEPHPLLVQRFVSYLSSLLNQNTSLSNLSEMQVNKIMKLVIEYITDDLSANADMYGLTSDYTERTRIGHIIFNSVFMVLNRALNGQEARRMWSTLNLTESNATQQKGSVISDALRFWK